MSGPGGSTTNRDRRREARKQAYQQVQSARQEVRKKQIRNQQFQRGTLVGGAVLILVLLGALVIFTTQHNGTPAPRTINGLACVPASSQGKVVSDINIQYYVSGKQVAVPTGVGVDSAAKCSYPLTVPQENFVAAHATDAKTTYTLGQFFDVWGQKLSTTQVGTHVTKQGEKVTYEIWDGNGHFEIYNGDPAKIQLQNHETIAILYESPNAHPLPYTDWSKVKN